jgi:hypothetical protein
MREKEIRERFNVALREYLKTAERGAKKSVAISANIAISTIYNIDKGRRSTSEAGRRRIVAAIGYDYDSFLNLGGKILAGETVDFRNLKLLPKPKINVEDMLPEQLVKLIEQIIYIGKTDISKLKYIEPTILAIYDDLKIMQNKKEEKLSA